MYKDMTGLKFGRLTVLRYAGNTVVGKNQKKLATWECACECGSQCIAKGSALRSGNTTSCGCYQVQSTIERSTSHGKSNSKEYRTYLAMMKRCFNAESKDFKHYQGRGITVCERWANSFESFYLDMGDAPSENHSIERLNVNGNYSKENCIWATAVTQARNKTNTRKAIFNGELLPVATIAEMLGRPYTSVIYRLNHGLDIHNWN